MAKYLQAILKFEVFSPDQESRQLHGPSAEPTALQI